MSRQQRLRQERGMERAEAVRDVRAKKVEKSLGRGKVGRERGVSVCFFFSCGRELFSV